MAGSKSQIGFKRCPKCGHFIVRPYFKYHECRLKKDGTIDKWEPYNPSMKGKR